MELTEAYEKVKSLKSSIHNEFIGKDEVLDRILVCLFAGGHVLLEDVPGVGKTMLAKVIARAAGLSSGRIQFTPDTLPGDVVGLSIYNMKTGDFTYKQGAVMKQLVLADEINRTPPKTQASLLEVMAEGQISVDGATYPLPQPFLVIATENPIEYVGTYPLPEAELDRFMMKLSIGYPEKASELQIAKNELKRNAEASSVPKLFTTQMLCAEEILTIKQLVKEVTVSDSITEYIEEIIRRTREDNRIRLGASTRALLSLLQASQAYAFIKQRVYVTPDDVKALVIPVLSHRLLLTAETKRQKVEIQDILRDILSHVRIPV